MAVTEQIPLNSYTANGVTTVFAFSYLLLQAADLAVQITDANGVTTTKTLNVDYTVAGLNVNAGGTVTFTAAPANGHKVVIYRDSAIERNTDYQDNGDLLADTVNLDFDRLYLLMQEIFNGGKGAPTALRVPNGETVPPLPNAATRADRLVGFDSSGNPIAVVPTPGDASALALDLASTNNAAKGAGQVGHSPPLAYVAGTAGSKLKDWVSPTDHPWLADKTGAADAVPALNSCYAWCKANGKNMRILNGTYLLGTTPYTFECPRDDGSYSPTIGSGETTLAAESAVTLPVALLWDGSVEVEGESAEDVILKGSWTYTSSPINTAQAVGVLFGSTKDGYTVTRLKNIKFKNLFIPMIVQGALARSSVEAIFDGCAIAACIQSAEGRTDFRVQMVRCYAGVIVGGWWLQRNRTVSATHMPSSFGGSYPATDIFRGCWAENIKFERIEWTAQPVFDARADSVDTFFNTNFFKSANSATYPTGRATVNADASFTAGAGYPTYRGVFGMPAAMISRNGRYGSAIKIDEFVSSGNSRPGIYINAGSQIAVRQFYCEKAGLVDPAGSTSGNTMGDARADPYRAGAVLCLSLWLEAEGGGGTYLEEIGGQNNASGVPQIDPARTYNVQLPMRSSSVQQFLGGVRFLDTDTALTRYLEAAFPSAPVIVIGTTDQAGWANDYATYKKINNTIFFRFSMSKATPAYSGTGSVTVKNLPVAAVGGGCVAVAYYSSYSSAGEIHAFVSGTTIQFSKGANRSTDLKDTDLGAGAGVLTVEGWYFA